METIDAHFWRYETPHTKIVFCFVWDGLNIVEQVEGNFMCVFSLLGKRGLFTFAAVVRNTIQS